jgi:hypothetical protein
MISIRREAIQELIVQPTEEGVSLLYKTVNLGMSDM